MTLTLPRICASVAGRASPLGVAIHDAAYAANKLPFKYVAVETKDLSETIKALVALNARGIAISMPFKTDVIKKLDAVSDDVKAIGACNTIVNDDGKLTGYNTDWMGAADALRLAGVKPGGKAVVVGSGGVARALIYALKDAGWKTTVMARNHKNAEGLAKEFRIEGVAPYGKPPYRGIDLVVNATPAASHPGGALELDWFPEASALLDVVFTPVETELCIAARARGLTAVPGWQMLLHQAAHQFKLYTGMDAPVDVMGDVLLANLKS